MSARYLFLLFSLPLTLAACAPVTQNQLAEKGAIPLTAQQVFDLVSGNTLHLEEFNFNSFTYFQPDGGLVARGESSTADDKDQGKWDINGDNQLCLKYSVWFYGDMKCYSVYPEGKKNSYTLFHDNGARAFAATAFSGDSAHLYKTAASSKKTVFMRQTLAGGQDAQAAAPAAAPAPAPAPDKKEVYLRQSLTTGSAPAAPQDPAQAADNADSAMNETASAEMEHTVKSMAKECPNCNLEKSDLRQADLVGANLKGANLNGADLSGANLRRANLEGAQLKGANLKGANLPGAILKGANLTEADLSDTNLLKTDFTGATTTKINLKNAHLENTKGLKE